MNVRCCQAHDVGPGQATARHAKPRLGGADEVFMSYHVRRQQTTGHGHATRARVSDCQPSSPALLPCRCARCALCSASSERSPWCRAQRHRRAQSPGPGLTDNSPAQSQFIQIIPPGPRVRRAGAEPRSRRRSSAPPSWARVRSRDGACRACPRRCAARRRRAAGLAPCRWTHPVPPQAAKLHRPITRDQRRRRGRVSVRSGLSAFFCSCALVRRASALEHRGSATSCLCW